MFIQDSSRELDISNVSHFFTHLRKCQPPKKLLVINNYHLAVTFQAKFFISLIQLYPFWRLKNHWLCQPPALSAAIITQNLGMNIFSSSQPLYMLPVPSGGEIIQLNNTDIFGCQPPINTFYEWNGGWNWKVHIYGVCFWLASPPFSPKIVLCYESYIFCK